MVDKYKRQYGSGIEALSYLGQNYFNVDRSLVPDFLKLLRDDEQFDYCVDITAAHYPKREKQFDVFWILYSFPRNQFPLVSAKRAALWSSLYVQLPNKPKPTRLNVDRYWRSELDQMMANLPAPAAIPAQPEIGRAHV